MRLFGLEITRSRASEKSVTSVDSRGGWFPIVNDPYPGAWQHNVTIDQKTVLSHHAVYSCLRMIASDIAKLRIKLVKQDDVGAPWIEIKNPAYDPVLRKPNHYQNRIQFMEFWILSKLIRGNTIVLKDRDRRGVVRALYPLDAGRVKPLIADTGDVFYELPADNLSMVDGPIAVPAREIIHDRMNCLSYPPLWGTSPILAAGLAATQGINIQNNSASFFANMARPSGFLTAPNRIDSDTAQRLKDSWEQNYGGVNRGKIAVLGDGLTFSPIMMTSVDAQLIEQLKWTAETVCSTFGIPLFKMGLGPLPSYNNVQALNVEYYQSALQKLIEDAEACLDEGLEMKPGLGTEFDLDGLLRMDSVTQMEVLDKAVKAAIYSPNEARQKVDKPPVEGGESPMIQQQNFSLAALAKRDAQENPFGSPEPAQPPAAEPEEPDVPDEEPDTDDTERVLAAIQTKFASADAAAFH
jgi:HK97 family phage portal protein